MSGWIGIYCRGLAMGSADLVPGVSGGTIALITGIYSRLLTALTQANVDTLRRLLSGQFAHVWRRIDGNFLLVLGAGIASAILGLAEAIQFLLQHYPLLLWSFFFGLVLASGVMLLLTELKVDLQHSAPALYFLVILGGLIAGFIGLSPQASMANVPGSFFLAGMLAISAMLLPGISGSFILLLLGMYTPVISAVTGRNLEVLALFASGCLIGLLVFSRVLHWLMQHLRQPVMAVLTGFLFGSLVILWPWQLVQSVITDRHGLTRTVSTVPVGPLEYAARVGDPQYVLCSGGFLLGTSIVLALSLARRRV